MTAPSSIRFQGFTLDLARLCLRGPHGQTDLRPKSFEVLRYLLERPGRVVSKTELMHAVWPDVAVTDESLAKCVSEIRRAIGDESQRLIKTVARRGYLADVITSGGEDMPPDLADRPESSYPSVAVLPFGNLSGNPDQDYFCDGITEDVITALARFKWFLVIARNSTFAFKGSPVDVRQIAKQLAVRYVLEGSVRRSGDRIRITAQLIDASTGSHIWAERYDRAVADIFAIQDDIANCVVGAIEPELLRTESRSTVTRRIEDMTAWDLVRRGMWNFHQVTSETHLRARDLFRLARERDPRLPEAHIWLARVSGGTAIWGWSEDPASTAKEGLAAALAAIHLDEKNPYAHYGLAITSVAANQLEQATRAAEKSIELSPSFALGYLVLGMSKLYAGHAHDAIAPLRHGLRLNPYDPHNFVWFDLLALAHLFSGELDQAVDAATRALKVRPAWHSTLETMAVCYAAADRLDEARHCVQAMRQVPAQPGGPLVPLKTRNPEWRDQIEKLVRKATAASDRNAVRTPD